MAKSIEQLNLDWHRDKVVMVRKRGTSALVTPQLDLNLPREVKDHPKCVWPSLLENSNSKFISRRVWGR